MIINLTEYAPMTIDPKEKEVIPKRSTGLAVYLTSSVSM